MKRLQALLLKLIGLDELEKFHHGDCVGADAQAHRIARQCGLYIIRHPPMEPAGRAFCDFDEDRPPKPFLVRNKEVVRESEAIIAMPDGPERLRSGTWSTVRYAHSLEREVYIIDP